ncbi:MAG: asparagine synthase C-terminal domain-containing protein [Deltaproteobacteria bacterium]|jgi:asparagine synthase (glutamine-hydrolysing)|nr:asparagine synthase C-terminal domain-containing protein [Deltaproteobacteria bacterium]
MSLAIHNRAGIYRPGQGPEIFLAHGRVFTPTDDSCHDLFRRLASDPQILNDLESDLSLAFYRPEDDSLILIRDACGATPLFLAKTPEGDWGLAFTLADLFNLLGRVPDINEETFYDFLATHYRYIFREPQRTFHRGVIQIPAGHYAVINRHGLSVKPWLKLTFDPEASKMDISEAGQKYLTLLKENVRWRLQALSPENLAFSISSGMDSSTVASLAASIIGPVETWFMAYKDQAHSPYDETKGVKALIQDKGWTLNRLSLSSPDLLKETSSLLAKTRAPIITVTWLAHYVLAKAAAQTGYKFLFSGLGGDESLAGEFEHFFLFFADLKSRGQTDLLNEETRAWIKLHDHRVFKKSPQVRDDWFDRNLDFKSGEIKVDQIRYQAYRRFFEPGWVEALEKRIPPPPMPRPYPYFLSNRLYQEMNYETSPPTLWSETLSSQAGGIKGIFPMASPRLFRLALSLPGTFKYRNGVTKMFLRLATRDLLPDSTRLNPVKTGFNAPLDLWLQDYRLAKEVLDLLTDGPLCRLGWLKKGAPEELVTAHLKGEANYMMLLWPLIVTSLFLEGK